MTSAITAGMKRPQRARGQGGFTLIELMISLVMFSFAIAGVLAAAVSMSQGLNEQRAAVSAESAVRVPLDFMQDALRQASPGAPTLNIQDAATCATNGAISVTNNMSGSGFDQLDVIYASGAVVTSLRSPYVAGTTTVTVNDGSQLAIGDSIVISNLTQGHLVKITNVVAAPPTYTLTLAPQCGSIVLPSGGYPAGSLVIRAQHSIFFISSITGVPTLMMNPTGDPTTNATAGEPLAEGIEDIQIALGYDQGTGSVIEHGVSPGDDGWQGNVASDPVITGATLRAVRLTLIARTTTSYIGAASVAGAFVRPAAEDHAVSTTPDTYRRRVLKTTAEIRNVGGSP